MDTEIAVSCRHVTKVYGDPPVAVVALSDVCLDIPRGRLTAVMGPSGSGKTTLLHVLSGLDAVSAGSIHLAGHELTSLNDNELTLLRRTNVGARAVVFQAFNLLPMYDALHNITLPLELAGKRPDLEWLDLLLGALGLSEYLTLLPHELSGGLQQRVAIARAFVTRPTVVFADEPTGNLDTRSGHEVLAILRTAVREWGQTIVLVTHDPAAASYADEVILLTDGSIAGRVTDPNPDAVMLALETLGNPDGSS